METIESLMAKLASSRQEVVELRKALLDLCLAMKTDMPHFFEYQWPEYTKSIEILEKYNERG